MNHQSAVVAELAPSQVVQSDLPGVLQRQGVTEKSWSSESETRSHDLASECLADTCLSSPATNGSNDDAGDNSPNFSRLEVRQGKQTINDDDAGRALVTRWLIYELAPLLGLDPSKIEIRVNREAESRTTARGAGGLMEDGRIYLHPKHYQPRAGEGRYLIAHEAAHVAQLQNAGETNDAEAEREAARIGRAFAEGRAFLRPQQRLSSIMAAAADAPAAPLADSVKSSRDREIAAIKKLLSGLWISDGDVFKVLDILSNLDFVVARTVIESLTPKERYELADNVNPPHFKKYRREVLACYRALTPDQFRKLDYELVEEMELNPLAMSVEEREAAAYTVHHLDDSSLRKLLDSNNRTFVKMLLAWPALEKQDVEALAKKEAEAAQAEAAEAARLKTLKESISSNSPALEVLKRIRFLLVGPASLNQEDVGAFMGQTISVLDELAKLGADPALMEYVGRQLDAEGLIDKLIDFLPESARFDTPEHTNNFLALLQTRLPEKNIQFAEELLSYGVLDWAVRDREAEFAYRLIKSLPLGAQDRFRKRDHGKWFMRLEDNVGGDLANKIEYRSIEVGRDASGKLFNAAVLYQEKLESGEGHTALTVILNLIQQEGLDRGTAEKIYAHIAAIGAARIENPPDKPGTKEATETVSPQEEGKPSRNFIAGDQVLMDAVVRRLDRLGYIETLFENLTDKFLFDTGNFASTLKIMLARDPLRVQAHARDLVSRGFLGLGMVTDREALLAFQLVRALPDAERQAFMEEDDGGTWSRILSEMSAEMRRSQSVNLYVGDKAGTDRNSILAQLLDQSTWTAENALKLDGLVHMAIAMGEYKFAFEQSAIGERYEIDELEKVFAKYSLYHPTLRPIFQPDILKGTKWYQEGIFESIRTLISGVVFLVKNDLLLFTRTQGADSLSLNDAQNVMGGDLKGVKLADPTVGQPDRKESPLPNPEANKVQIHFDPGARVFTAWLPQLRIDSVNYQAGSLTVQCGMLTLDNLQVTASFGSEDSQQPSDARLTSGALNISDLLLAFRDSMVAASHFFVSGVTVGAGTTDTEKGSYVEPRGGYHVPVPFLARISALIWYLFKYKGWWGAQTPMNAAMEGFELLRSAEISFGSLRVEGLTTSGGQSIGAIDVKDFHLRLGLTRPAFLRAQVGSLKQRITQLEHDQAPAADIQKLTAQRDKAQAELKTLEPNEAELVKLETKYLHDRSNFTDDDRIKIESLQKDLKGGAFLDIGSIDVAGIGGTVTAEPIHLKGIHGEGASAAMGIGFVTDEQFIRKFAGEEKQRFDPKSPELRQPSLSEQAGDTKFTIEIEDFKTGKVTVSGLATSADLDQRLADLRLVKDRPGYKEDYQKLQTLRDKAALYEQFMAIGLSALKEDERKIAAQLREELMREPKLVIDSIVLKQARLTFDLSKNRVGVGAQEATVKGVDYRQMGLKISEIYAQNLDAGATSAGGLLGWLEWRKNLQSGDLSADLLRLRGVEHAPSGMGAAEISVESLGVDATFAGDKTKVGVKTPKIQATGLSVAFVERVLRYQRQQLEAKEAETRSEEEKQKLKDLIYLLDELEFAKRLIDEADMQLADENLKDDERLLVQKEKEDAIRMMAEWQKSVTVKKLIVSDLDIGISGLGDVLQKGYSFGQAYKTGITISGRGKDQQMASGVTATGVWQKLSPGETTELKRGGVKVTTGRTATLEEIQTGPVRGAVELAEDHVELMGFVIDKINISNFNYAGAGSTIWSPATNTINKLSIDARLDLSLVDEEVPVDRYVSAVHVKSFNIESIDGSDLHYKSLQSGLSVHISSGKLSTIFAEGVNIDLPKPLATDPSPLKIHGGTAGFNKAENVHAAATTAGGLTVRGVLNANTLSAGFADDGTITADLLQLSVDSGTLKQGDLDAKFNAKAKGLRVTVIPGAKGYEDATQKFKVAELEGHASGKKGTTEFAVDVTKASTGEITKLPDGTIIAPAIHLPDIQLTRLFFDNDKYKIDVPAGQTIALQGTELSVKLEPNKNPKADEFGYDRILLQKLVVPRIDFHGLTLELKEKGITVNLPEKESGFLLGLELSPDSQHPEGFIIEPNKDWNLLGNVVFTQAQFKGISGSMNDIIAKTADINAEGFSLAFLGSGASSFELKTLSGENIEGTFKGSPFWISKSPTSKFPTVTPGFKVHDLKKDKDGNITLGDLDVQGLRYKDTGLGMDIELMKGTLPKREDGKAAFEKLADGSIGIPELKIEEAYFRIDDVLNMKSAPSSGKKVAYGPDWRFLDRLNGFVNFDVTARGGALQNALDSEYEIRIPINNGQVNYAEVEHTAFGLGDLLVDFRLSEPQFGGAIPPRFNIWIIGTTTHVWWNLSEAEATLARSDLIQISTFFRHSPQTPAPMPWDPPPERSITSLRYRNIDVDLRLPGQTEITLGKNGESGSITLGGGDGLPFRFSAQSPAPDAFVTSLPVQFIANVSKMNLKTDVEGGRLTTGSINISSVGRTTISFAPGLVGLNTMDQPKTLEGTIDSATAKDIRWKPGAAKEKK